MKTLTKLAISTLCAASTMTQAESLSEIYELALKNDPTYQIANAQYRIDKNSKFEAWANFLPKYGNTLSGRYDHDGRVTEQRIGSLPESRTRNEGGSKSVSLSGLNYSFNVGTWFTFKNGLLGDELSEAVFAQAQQALILRVADVYFEVLRTHENLQSAKKAEASAKRDRERARERFALGLSTRTDTQTSEANYHSRVSTTLDARNNFDIAFETLGTLTGKNHYQVSRFKESLPVEAPTPLNPDLWIKTATENNFALMQARLVREQTLNSNKSDKLNFTPTVSANWGGYNYLSAPGSSRLQQQPDGTPMLVPTPSIRSKSHGGGGVSVDIPLFNNGLNFTARRKAAQRDIQARQQYTQTYRQIMLDTRIRFMTVRTNASQVEAQKLALRAAQSSLEAIQAGYDAGLNNILDLLNEQQRLVEAENSYTQARYQYITNSLQLKAITGQLSPADIYELDNWLEQAEDVKATSR